MLLCLELVVGISLLRPLPWARAPDLSPASFRPASTMAYSTVYRTVSLHGHALSGSIPIRSTKITTEVPIWTPLLLLELVVGIEPTTCSLRMSCSAIEPH